MRKVATFVMAACVCAMANGTFASRAAAEPGENDSVVVRLPQFNVGPTSSGRTRGWEWRERRWPGRWEPGRWKTDADRARATHWQPRSNPVRPYWSARSPWRQDRRSADYDQAYRGYDLREPASWNDRRSRYQRRYWDDDRDFRYERAGGWQRRP